MSASRLVPLLVVAACGSDQHAPKPAAVPVEVPSSLLPDLSARAADLEMIWISHVDIDASQAPHDQAGVTRSRTEASALATRLRAQIDRDPPALAALARTYSDDRISRQFGGALGVTPIGTMPRDLAATVAALSPGALAPVIETQAGFYIMRRRVETPDVRLSAATIFVTWSGTDTLVTPSEPRAREDALARIAAVRTAAAASPISFAALVDRFTDDRERAEQAGWEGVWSANAFPLENYAHLTQATLAIAPGEVSPVIEGRDGYYLVQRLPLIEPPAFSATEIVVSFADARLAAAARPTARTRDEARAFAQRIAETTRHAPATFDAQVAAESDSPTAQDGGRRRWTKGRMLARVDAAIEHAAVGDIVGPIETPLGFAIYRRDP
jgi:parvulin-like peptidyl-prolyl isomerase